ncbi:MAG: VOC family protein [Steroidobacteraceae bacterium]
MPTKAIPVGYHSVTPYLVMRDAARAIDFYKRALGAKELFRFDAPGGKIGHAEIKVGDSVIMLADEMPDMGYRGPQSLGGSAVSLMVYVEDVDSQFKRATDAGAKVKQDVKDQFYGDRSGTFEDPFGHVWTIATHVEDVSEDELAKRAAAMHKQAAREERAETRAN